MLRSPQIIIACSFPIRSRLIPAVCEHTGALWRGSRHVKENQWILDRCRGNEWSSLSKDSGCCSLKLSLLNSGCDDHRLIETSFQNPRSRTFLNRSHQPPQHSTSEKDKPVSDPCTSPGEDNSGPDPQALSTYHNCLTNTTCLHAWKRRQDFSHVPFSFSSKTLCNLPLNHLYHRSHFTRFFSTSTHNHTNHFHSRSQAASIFIQQNRPFCQASPHVVVDWRDCLTVENENRCRQSLRPNLKLYDTFTGSNTSESQWNWASILISLCSVQGQPAFLFTLRSTALGRNKGDVSFAGGKCDPSDSDVVATALRETWEELGINVAVEQVWGVLKPLRDRSRMVIAPVLANLGPLEELSFNPNPAEVEEVFTLPLSHLCNPQNCGYTHFRMGDKYGYTLPVFHNRNQRVWGLTATALERTLKLIVPS
ncbi:nucleoside diphosphate-linked moiety X motif 8 [Solea solea]|uniref:nucleoside diphosphate-linked moiety X motif 8 n=1 Tax=Solea solea TaxID=90069 RepID=UPI002729C7D1|nr:nucleoside diphosphate-linked moiety X motif 8 [Solea solea]